jgi:hypothetical protein
LLAACADGTPTALDPHAVDRLPEHRLRRSGDACPALLSGGTPAAGVGLRPLGSAAIGLGRGALRIAGGGGCVCDGIRAGTKPSGEISRAADDGAE